MDETGRPGRNPLRDQTCTTTSSSTIGMMRTVSGVLSLPLYRVLRPGLSAVIDHVHEADVQEVHSLLKGAADAGADSGVSSDQFQTEGEVRETLDQGYNVCFKDEGEGRRIFAFFNIVDSALSRSTKSIMHAGYIVLHEDYQAKGLAKEVGLLYFMTGMALGYSGFLGRATILSPRTLMSLKPSTVFLGTIPDSSNMADRGWVDDVITYSDYRRAKVLGSTSATETAPATTVPILTQNGIQRLLALKSHQKVVKCRGSTWYGKRVMLDITDSASEAAHVEELIRSTAMKGEGFALDEFTSDGRLNRKLFHDSITLAAREKGRSHIIGCAVVGPSAICRSTDPCSLGWYIVVAERYRGASVGRDILRTVESIAQELHYSNMLTDVFACNASGLKFALKNGYLITGQMPGSGFSQERRVDFRDLAFQETLTPQTLSLRSLF